MDKILEICKVVFLGIIAFTLIFVALNLGNLTGKFVSEKDINEKNATASDIPMFKVNANVEIEEDIRSW